MYFFARFAPVRAVMDLRRYLARRHPYEIAFLFLAIAVTTFLVTLLVNDSRSIEVPYDRKIIYVEQWRADRTDAEIRAQQKIDQVKQAAIKAELDRLQKKRQAELKAIDDKLKAYGF
jgi:hypothetical protein